MYLPFCPQLLSCGFYFAIPHPPAPLVPRENMVVFNNLAKCIRVRVLMCNVHLLQNSMQTNKYPELTCWPHTPKPLRHHFYFSVPKRNFVVKCDCKFNKDKTIEKNEVLKVNHHFIDWKSIA